MEGLLNEALGSTAVLIIIGLLLLLVVVRLAAWLLAPPKESTLQVRVRCLICGWEGRVGKYNRRCSACGSDTLESIRR
ncbi:MAG: hypothetical protein JXO72_04280 [Vicinamibacteria bacterium]|nr:hypothetical protein [Vicinamibacteria bacterium]